MASIFSALTPTWLKERFLLGVDLTLDNGDPYPDSIFDQSLRSAVVWLEHELGIRIDPVSFTRERHDAWAGNRNGWWPFHLDQRPIWTIDGFRIRFGSYEAVDIPNDWVQRVSDIHGQVHLIPSQETLGSYHFRAGIPLIAGDVFQPAEYIPGYFEFDYTAGFPALAGTETILEATSSLTVTLTTPALVSDYEVTATLTDANGAVGLAVANRTLTSFDLTLTAPPGVGGAAVAWTLLAVPYDIRQCIGYKAALVPLDVAGDLIVGAGLASISTSMDGLSQSINTTASATNCLVGGTLVQLADGTQQPIEALVGREPFDVACVNAEGHQITGQAHSARPTLQAQVWRVLLSTGQSVLCSANHPFRLRNGDWIDAEHLRPGDDLTVCALATDDKEVIVRALVRTPTKEQLYDLTVDEHHCFGLGAGVIVHNSGYGARVLQFERELKSLLPALRGKYKSMNIGVI